MKPRGSSISAVGIEEWLEALGAMKTEGMGKALETTQHGGLEAAVY